MKKIANGLTALVALEHLWFLIVEMFLWTKPIGMKMFALEPDFAQKTATLAAN
jgi:putative membrane protein